MRDKVVLLGSSGFAGGALMAELGRRADVSVEGYSSATLDLESPEATERLGRILDEETILISVTRPRFTGDPVASFTRDAAMASNLARCLLRRRIRKLVHVGTVSVYDDGVTNLAVSEETPLAPSSLYGIAKMAGEFLLRDCAAQAGAPAVILRPCKIYGPGDSSGSYGPAAFVESILKGQKVALYGDGGELRALLYIEDLVRITLALALGEASGIYNLVSGESHSFRDILSALRSISGKEFEVARMARTRPRVDQGFDASKLMAAMPGFKFTPLSEGLRQTYESFRARFSDGGD